MLFICFSATSWETLWQVIYVERNRPNGECSTLSLARAIEKCLAPYATHSSRASQIIHIISASADHFIASNIIRINMVRTKLECFSVVSYAFSLSSSRMQMSVLGPAARHIQMCSAPKWPRHRTKPLMWTMRAMPAMACLQIPFRIFACYYNFRYTIQSPTNNGEHTHIKLQTQTTAHWIVTTTKNSATASAATTKQCVNLCRWWSHRQPNKTVVPVFSCERDRRRKTTSENRNFSVFVYSRRVARCQCVRGGLIAWKQQKYQTKHKKFRSFLWRTIFGWLEWLVRMRTAHYMLRCFCLWLVPDVEKTRCWNSARRSHLVLTLTASHVFSPHILLFLFTPFFVDARLIAYRRACNYCVNTPNSPKLMLCILEKNKCREKSQKNILENCPAIRKPVSIFFLLRDICRSHSLPFRWQQERENDVIACILRSEQDIFSFQGHP